MKTYLHKKTPVFKRLAKQLFTVLLFTAAAVGKPATTRAQFANVTDSLALVDLYNSTAGPNWTNNSGWMAGPVAGWNGVTLDANGRVTSLILSNYNLTGPIPSSIGNLTGLITLDFDGANLNGSIPSSIGNLAKLTYLGLYGNQLSGAIPSSIGNLTNLAELELGSNQLTGAIPSSIGSLANLTDLNLGSNQLTGAIPSSIGSLANLTDLELVTNNLTGTIPSSIGNLTNLIQLNFKNNRLTGSIPSTFGNLTNLTLLYLANNKLTGTIPASFFNISNSVPVDISYNYYTYDGTEAFAGYFPNSNYGSQDTVLPLHFANGKISVSAGGTLSNNNYFWYYNYGYLTGINGDSTLPATAPGIYNAFITNSQAPGLQLYSDTIEINAKGQVVPPPVLSGYTTTQPSSCGTGNDGGATVYITGGTAPYTFTLTSATNSITQPTNIFTGLGAGTYSVSVTDQAGLVATVGQFVLTQTLPTTLTPYVLPLNGCGNGGGGTITANKTGGTGPFVYMLTEPGGATVTQSNNTFTGLAPGTYSLAVTDAAGCPGTATGIMVTQAAPLVITPWPSPLGNCTAVADGIIYAGNTGGVYPKEFTLTGPGGTTTQRNIGIFNHLGAGTYSITITDTTGCTTTATGIILAQAAPITLTPYVLPVNGCGNSGGGTITAGRAGGVWPFEYTLTGAGGATTQRNNDTFGGLAPGMYNIAVTDSAGCTGAAAGITVAQAAPIVLTPHVDGVSNCNNGTGADGTIYAGNTGGAYPKEFTLTYPDGTTLTQRNIGIFVGLATGTYGITITDTTGCTAAATGIVVGTAAPLRVTATATPVTDCNFGNNGAITAAVHGGAGPYTYSVTPEGLPATGSQSSNIFNNLYANYYNLTVTDAGGCTASANNINVTEVYPSVTVTSIQQPSCISAADGQVTATASGGTQPYTFSIQVPGMQVSTIYPEGATGTFTGVPAGTYNVSINDALGCSNGTDYFTLASTTPCAEDAAAPGVTPRKAVAEGKAAGSLAVQVLPNPSTTTFTLAVSSAKTDAVEITVTDMYGRTVHHAEGVANRQYTFGGNFAAGMYIARVMQGNEVKTVKMVKQ